LPISRNLWSDTVLFIFPVNQVKEICDIFARNNVTYRWQKEALMALQEAAEAYLVRLFEDAYVFICFF
jgi:histone H3/H4